jgi:hypothetical protein
MFEPGIEPGTLSESCSCCERHVITATPFEREETFSPIARAGSQDKMSTMQYISSRVKRRFPGSILLFLVDVVLLVTKSVVFGAAHYMVSEGLWVIWVARSRHVWVVTSDATMSQYRTHFISPAQCSRNYDSHVTYQPASYRTIHEGG